MLNASTDTPFNSERIDMINFPRPHIPTEDEYQRIRTLCIAASYTKLLNSDSTDRKARVADGIFMAISAWEMGIPPMVGLRHMYTTNGKIGCTMQMLLATARRAGVQFQIPNTASVNDMATVGIRRPGEMEWRFYSYTIEMATAAGLMGKKNWLTMTKIMLVWRAIGVAIRFEIPDIVGGMYPLEELLPDAEYDESGSPVGNLILYNPQPESKPKATQKPASSQPQRLADGNKEPEAAREPAVWPSASEGDKLVKFVAFKMQIKSESVLKYAGITDVADISTETGWGKYATAEAAALAIKAAFEEEQKNTPPATPKSPFGGAPVNKWTADELVKIGNYVETNFFDLEADLPMHEGTMWKLLGIGGWLDIPSGYKDAVSRIMAYVNEHPVAICVTRAKWISTNKGAYVLLSNEGGLSVRLYGRDQLRKQGPEWELYAQTLEDKAQHVFEKDHMPDIVITKWEVKQAGDDNKTAYNIVLDDGIYIPTTTF